eukprot:jgi/Psemu1/14237/gm1.14237_g
MTMIAKSIVHYTSCPLLLLILSSSLTSSESYTPSKKCLSLDRSSFTYKTVPLLPAAKYGTTRLKTRSISLQGGDDNNTSPAEERAKANAIMEYCAKITALSAALDFTLDGSKLIAGIAAGKWILPLRTLWKVSFSYNMWRVSKMYKEKTKTKSELYQLLEKLMISMTGIWRRLAFIVTLLTLEGVISVWHDSLPNIRLVLNVLYGAVGVISVKLSAKETQNLIVERPPPAGSRSDEDPMQQIARLGRVAVRAMSLGVSAFLLDSFMIPVIALRKTRTEGIVELLDLTVSIPVAILLWKLRKSYIAFIEDLAISDSSKQPVITAETQIQLAIAQQNFWGKIKSFLLSQMFMKVLATIVQLQLVQKLAGFFPRS